MNHKWTKAEYERIIKFYQKTLKKAQAELRRLEAEEKDWAENKYVAGETHLPGVCEVRGGEFV